MAVYTTNQYIKKLNSLTIDPKPFFEVTNEIIIRQDKRVFDKGVDGNGAKIGKYATKPIYVSISGKTNKVRNLKTPPRGKSADSKSTFLNGKKRKSVYFPGGYLDFKRDVGKDTVGSVNLWLSGNFRKAFQNSADPLKSSKNGFVITYSLKVSALNDDDKLRSILNRYPTAFMLTKGERQYVIKRFQQIFFEQIRLK